MVKPDELRNWVMLMQVWGRQNPKIPHLSLPHCRLQAHQDLDLCIEKLRQAEHVA